jgi:hypothetical protein
MLRLVTRGVVGGLEDVGHRTPLAQPGPLEFSDWRVAGEAAGLSCGVHAASEAFPSTAQERAAARHSSGDFRSAGPERIQSP